MGCPIKFEFHMNNIAWNVHIKNIRLFEIQIQLRIMYFFIHQLCLGIKNFSGLYWEGIILVLLRTDVTVFNFEWITDCYHGFW